VLQTARSHSRANNRESRIHRHPRAVLKSELVGSTTSFEILFILAFLLTAGHRWTDQ